MTSPQQPSAPEVEFHANGLHHQHDDSEPPIPHHAEQPTLEEADFLQHAEPLDGDDKAQDLLGDFHQQGADLVAPSGDDHLVDWDEPQAMPPPIFPGLGELPSSELFTSGAVLHLGGKNVSSRPFG